jgi:hypothetical protein
MEIAAADTVARHPIRQIAPRPGKNPDSANPVQNLFQGIEKLVPQPGLPLLVPAGCLNRIVLCVVKDAKTHRSGSPSSA